MILFKIYLSNFSISLQDKELFKLVQQKLSTQMFVYDFLQSISTR